MTEDAYRARCFLKEMIVLNTKMKINRLAHEDLLVKASGCGSINAEVRVQSSPTFDGMEIAVSKMLELDERYKEMFTDYMRRLQTASGIIEEIEDNRLKNVLTLKYCASKTTKEVARQLNYDYDYLRKLHAIALDAFGKKMETSH